MSGRRTATNCDHHGPMPTPLLLVGRWVEALAGGSADGVAPPAGVLLSWQAPQSCSTSADPSHLGRQAPPTLTSIPSALSFYGALGVGLTGGCGLDRSVAVLPRQPWVGRRAQPQRRRGRR